MKRHAASLVALAAATVTVTTLGLTASAASAAASGATAASIHSLPEHVFAPYFETYDTSAGPAALARQSGARFLSLAFLETAQAGSCTAYWNGDTSEPISQASFGSDIAAIQASGGNVIPSFGGYTADTTGTELADSCSSVSSIAQVYENLITTYNVPRIDLDIEGTSLSDTAGINRRNEAVAQTEAWAAAHGRSIQFSYTLPTFPTGLPAAELAVLQNAVADGAKIAAVNLLTFDYYIGTEQNMVTDTESAASALVGQLQTLYPGEPSGQLWHMVGVTEMPGIDDFGPDETFTKAQALAILLWADRMGIGTLSFWALQRDNGGCPGTKGAGTCSGITQPTWFFSHVFELFTR
ncbi:MAG TPA: glycosyl hydrolase family 18 protein [Streptosporangiaceae bacterium]|jgi:Glycosyl hydrolases family 18|nr:glycosyl hydrolase family 18 protein [Streptosporangiaceae bacterium]